MRLKKHPEYPVKTKYDGLAQFLFWKNLKLKDKDYWRGLAQIHKEDL